jgi:hypothetical protein
MTVNSDLMLRLRRKEALLSCLQGEMSSLAWFIPHWVFAKRKKY